MKIYDEINTYLDNLCILVVHLFHFARDYFKLSWQLWIKYVVCFDIFAALKYELSIVLRMKTNYFIKKDVCWQRKDFAPFIQFFLVRMQFKPCRKYFLNLFWTRRGLFCACQFCAHNCIQCESFIRLLEEYKFWRAFILGVALETKWNTETTYLRWTRRRHILTAHLLSFLLSAWPEGSACYFKSAFRLEEVIKPKDVPD